MAKKATGAAKKSGGRTTPKKPPPPADDAVEEINPDEVTHAEFYEWCARNRSLWAEVVIKGVQNEKLKRVLGLVIDDVTSEEDTDGS